MNEFLPDLSKEQIMVGIFPVPNLCDTPVVDVKDLLRDLEHICIEYF